MAGGIERRGGGRGEGGRRRAGEAAGATVARCSARARGAGGAGGVALGSCAALALGVSLGTSACATSGAAAGAAAVGAGAAGAGETRTHLLRLTPGQELVTELRRAVAERGIVAGSIVSCVGSLTDVALRFADRAETTTLHGHFEIVSLSGYLGAGELHLHMAVADGEGRTVGGHVMEGNRVYTTLFVAIEDHPRWRYRRERSEAEGREVMVLEEVVPAP